VGVGTNMATLTDTSRKDGIFTGGPITAPVAATFETETPAPTPTA
jgi:hypothetical protein